MKDLNWKAIMVGVAIVIALFGVFKVSQHAWEDHANLHFTGGLLEAVRQAVLEAHPELATSPPPAPVTGDPLAEEEAPE